MVTTRSQTYRAPRQDGRSPLRVVVDSDGDSDGDDDSRGPGLALGTANRRRSTEPPLAHGKGGKGGKGGLGGKGGYVALPEPTELLGRGHRVSRQTRTLDEEYLASSYFGAHTRGGAPAPRAHPGRGGVGEEEFVIHERYPPRAAAQRALSSLQHTLNSESGAEGPSEEEGSGGEDQGRSGVSSGYRLRLRTGMGERVGRRAARWRRAGSTSTSSSRSSSGSESSESSTASSTSSVSSASQNGPRVSAGVGVGGRRRGRPPLARTSASAVGPPPPPPARATTNTSAGGGGGAYKRRRDVSTDSSISNESMREASIAAAAREDERVDRRARGVPGSDEDTDSAADAPATDRDLRHALRCAKESTSRNVRINYFMRDAIGEEDSHTKRRRRIDRRYRHLLMLDEDCKDAEAGGIGGTGGLGGGGSLTGPTSGGGGGGGSGGGGGGADTAAGSLGDMSPLTVASDITFASVGGLPGHVVALREMVLLPLLYPQLLKSMNVSPPRGVLFVGPPGTGKTLMARALAVEGSRCGERKVTFFMRKGADILSKWVGESERQLRLLFEEARRLQPSIIFFDEIDGLAPARHTKTEQTQAALVATLLALLDGLDDRGQVVVVGATNRPDTMDPALRRPGRFDRELLFPLPDGAARRHILTILTAKQTFAPPSAPTRTEAGRAAHATEERAAIIEELVAHTEGYSGADLKALCVEAGLNRLRTALPQLYTTSKKLLLPTGPAAPSLAVRREDFAAAVRRVGPSLRRGGPEMHALYMEEHLDLLLRTARDALLASVAECYAPVARALERERRDCGDLQSAVRRLTSFPIPHAHRGLLCFVHVLDEPAGERAAPYRDADALARRPSTSKSRSKSRGAGPRESVGAEWAPAQPTAATAAARQMVGIGACVAVMRGLPAFQAFVVHLPHLRVSFQTAGGDVSDLLGSTLSGSGGESGGESGGTTGLGFGGGHIYQLVQAVQRCSPCMVLLRGAEEWLRDQGLPPSEAEAGRHGTAGVHASGSGDGRDGEEGERNGRSPARFSPEEYAERQARVQSLRYYLNLLAGTEVVLLVPCASESTRRALLGESPPTTPTPALPTRDGGSRGVEVCEVPAGQHELHPHWTVLRAGVRPVPTRADLARFVAHLYRTIALALRVQSVMAVRVGGGAHPSVAPASPAVARPAGTLPVWEEDPTPPRPLPLSREQRRAQHAEALALWRRVEYRRLQLRHVLLKWCTQFVNQGRFRILMSADLDLTADSDLLRAWRHHTKRTRIGLEDILARLEEEQYVCLSQFHDDVDQLVQNVRSFFRSRAQSDQRYRFKALELKEATVLNMYKINRNVVRLCEAHRDLVEPPPLDEGPRRRRRGACDGEGAESGPDTDGESEKSGAGPQDRRAPAKTAAGADALRFPPHAPREVRPRRKFRVFGQRRRRRRRAAPVAKALRQSAAAPPPDGLARHPSEEEGSASEESSHTEGEEEGGEQDCGPPWAASTQAGAGVHARSPDSVSRTSPSTSRSGGARQGKSVDTPGLERASVSPDINGSLPPPTISSPLSPLSLATAVEVEGWAVAVLAGLTYRELHEVFQGVMQQLEAEVRAREGAMDGLPAKEGGRAGCGRAGGEERDSPETEPARSARIGAAEEDSPQPRPSLPPSVNDTRRYTVGAAAVVQRRREAEAEAEAEVGGRAERPEAFFAKVLSSTISALRARPFAGAS